MEQFWSHPLTVTVVGAVIVGFIFGFFNHIKKQLSIVIHKLELTRIDVIAMDYAIEQSLPRNGYSDYRALKKEELLKNSEFINKQKE